MPEAGDHGMVDLQKGLGEFLELMELFCVLIVLVVVTGRYTLAKLQNYAVKRVNFTVYK